MGHPNPDPYHNDSTVHNKKKDPVMQVKYQIFLNRVLNHSVLANQRDLLDKIGKISFYSSDVHQETFLLEYFDKAAKKYILN